MGRCARCLYHKPVFGKSAFDPIRASTWEGLRTGIFVRAKDQGGKYQSVDIALLDAVSLLAWLRSRGGQNFWAENTLGRLLGHNDLSQCA
jgi:hypothetical protein